MEPFALPSPLREALQCCAPRSVSSQGRLQPVKPHLGKHNEFFGKSNLAFFMNKIYFQSMSTPINKNTSLAGIAKAVLGAPCSRKYFCFSINFLRPACFFPGLSLQGKASTFSLEGKGGRGKKKAGAMTNSRQKHPQSRSFKELKLSDAPSSCTLPPSRNPERNWALSDEQRREETPPPPPPPSHPLLKTQPQSPPPLHKPCFSFPAEYC